MALTTSRTERFSPQPLAQPMAALTWTVCWALVSAWPRRLTCVLTISSRAITLNPLLAPERSSGSRAATLRPGRRQAFSSRAPSRGYLHACQCTPPVAHVPRLMPCPSWVASSTMTRTPLSSCCPGRTYAAALRRTPCSQQDATEQANATWPSRIQISRFPSSTASSRSRGGSWGFKRPWTSSDLIGRLGRTTCA